MVFDWCWKREKEGERDVLEAQLGTELQYPLMLREEEMEKRKAQLDSSERREIIFGSEEWLQIPNSDVRLCQSRPHLWLILDIS